MRKSANALADNRQWIDGINQPQWGRQQWQVYSPTTEPAMNYAKYQFSIGN